MKENRLALYFSQVTGLSEPLLKPYNLRKTDTHAKAVQAPPCSAATDLG
jgi:hypothetical protein